MAMFPVENGLANLDQLPGKPANSNRFSIVDWDYSLDTFHTFRDCQYGVEGYRRF